MSICRRLRIAAIIILVGVTGTVQAGVAFQGQVLDYQTKELYSLPADPNNPGVLPYTAWTGIWKLANGTIQTDFVQGIGPQSNPVITNPVLESSDNGLTWSRVAGDIPTGYSRGMAVLPDGTMVRPAEVDVFGPSGPYPSGILQRRDNFMGVQRSTDGGKTWSQPINLVSLTDYQRAVPTVVKCLSDGRLVCFAGLVANDAPTDKVMANIVKTMFVSSDGGQTWGAPITVMPTSTGVCEETDFVELSNGDLMFISRAQHYNADGSMLSEDRLQTMVRKTGDTFVPDANSTSPFCGNGFPCELMTKEGIILDLAMGESHWSDDQGQSWHNLLVGGRNFSTYYYPQAVQAEDGTIVVVSHNGTDAVYGTISEPIMVQTFRLGVAVPEPSGLSLLGIGIVSLLTYPIQSPSTRTWYVLPLRLR